MSESYVTLNFKGFVVKPCNGTKKLRSNYVWKLRQNYI